VKQMREGIVDAHVGEIPSVRERYTAKSSEVLNRITARLRWRSRYRAPLTTSVGALVCGMWHDVHTHRAPATSFRRTSGAFR